MREGERTFIQQMLPKHLLGRVLTSQDRGGVPTVGSASHGAGAGQPQRPESREDFLEEGV